ncbi:MAG: hypothetical protein WAV32_03965 [Halobacteriota archaeon]
MNKKEIAILAVLAITIIGAGIAFIYIGTNIGMMEKAPYKIEEIPGQNKTETGEVLGLTEIPSKPNVVIIGKNDTGKIPELTEEQK